MNRVERAVSCFNEGFSCSQSVFSTYAEHLGIDRETALRLAGGLGGGMGRMGETCGALTGAVLVIGLVYGSTESGENEAKIKTYSLVQEAFKRFGARCGSVNCRDLLGSDICSPENRAQVRDQGLFGTVCPKCVRDAAEILEEIVELPS
ncbi:C-GCAxxG-C-C family protein [bacterium]|nr:C-GCAxxG-C-C family protein [bacterium]